jgi:hypothetical protein
MGSKASKSAASTQAASAQASTDAQERMFERQVELQEPFREAGMAGQNRLMELLGLGKDKTAADFGKYASAEFTPAQFTASQDPGYAFRLSEGMKALNQTAAARGGLVSGGALRGATRYGQEMGSQEYEKAYNRFQTSRANTLNPFASLGGVAQSSANTLTSAAGNLGGQIGANIIGAGNARASGYVGQANALTNALGTGFNLYQGQQYLNRLPNYSTATPSAGPELLNVYG